MSVPKFLENRGTRTIVKIGILHDLPLVELIDLRNKIIAYRDMLELFHLLLDSVVEIKTTHSDFKTLRMNKHMIPEVLDRINGSIGRRRMAEIQKQREEKMKNE